ncbi:U3 small nucleolar RNA-associated protein 15 homolog [Ylistrum balloti]|uniref:U3 small nucleolar RNA-associated protein 15 homolog n=1 Tax=Ylistrum balloti TaxID=509963 RepID=UPI002905F1E8|nr:U3 small nucleolar RNA-associated protein 15 homolog [Ylistrum balloti]
MAASFKKTVIKSTPRVGENVTSDTNYWKNLEVPVTKKEYGAITHIEFSPTEPNSFAVTNSTRVQIYSSKSLQILKTISRFKDVAYSGSFRDDGKLLVAGGDEGLIRLFDVEGRALLRVFKGHTGAVHVTKFLRDRVRLFSGADDNSVAVWDIPREAQIATYKEHQDYVRCGVSSLSSNDILLTGSYDHKVKLYDTRIGDSVLTVDHGQPVEDVLTFPTGGIFISAGGNVVKVWDALSGGRLLTTLCNHHKQVMSLAFCSNYQRLLSASLDRHVKIYDLSSYQVVHTLDYPGTLTAVAVSPDDNLLVVGTAEGLVSIQKRKPEDEVMPKKKKVQNSRFGLKGKTHIPDEDDYHVEHTRKDHLTKYDKFLKKFEYSRALDAAMHWTVRLSNPDVTLSVLQELIRREGIRPALAGREEKSLSHLLRFIEKNIYKPRYMNTLIDIMALLLEMYKGLIDQSHDLGAHLKRVNHVVQREVALMKQLYEVMGTMDTLFAAATSQQTNQTSELGLADERLTPSTAAAQSV